ncbi:MAG: uroporphyrinogen decarboxylase family protein [Halanaerobiales bacterium]
MTSKEKINKIFNLSANKSGFWTGNPKEETVELYLDKLNLKTREELYTCLNDDCRWIRPESENAYKHPEGKPMFDPTGGVEKTHHGQDGYFADCKSLKEVENYPWPDPDYLDFSEVLSKIDQFPDKAIFTGLWSPFFHLVSDFFGMENYFVKMYTDPEIVKAVTDHIVDFYVEANRRFFEELGDKAEIFFFGNDFGTQQDLLISPDNFKEFVLPGFQKLINVAKDYDKKVLLHSCGSIYKVIPFLIDAGIDGLHPLQAQARNMEAEKLAREFKKDIAFVGGVDTQDLLVNATPEEIKEEVYRLREVFGANFIVSPSHEALLPNVPLENTLAMAEAAKEINQ